MRLFEMIRKAVVQERTNDIETFTETLWCALVSKGYTDIETSNVLNELIRRHHKKVSDKKQRLEQEFLQAEIDNDFNN